MKLHFPSMVGAGPNLICKLPTRSSVSILSIGQQQRVQTAQELERNPVLK